MLSNHLRECDFIRGGAALSVIAIHVTALYVITSSWGYMWNQAMRYAVPVFVLLSGFLLAHGDRERERIPYAWFMKKRLQKIMMPYLIWTALYTLYVQAGQWNADTPWQEPLAVYAKHLALGTGYVHLYFLVIILQLYLLYPWLFQQLHKRPSLLLGGSLGCSLLGQAAVYGHQLGWYVLPSIGMAYANLFPMWLVYFVLGMWLSLHRHVWADQLIGRTRLLAGLWLASFAVLLADSHYTQTYASSLKPSVMVYSVTSFLLAYVLASRWKHTRHLFACSMEWLATHSFLIFLLHPLVISLLTRLAARVGEPWWKGTPGMVGLFAATTALTILLTHLLRYVPFTVILGGIPANQRKASQQRKAVA